MEDLKSSQAFPASLEAEAAPSSHEHPKRKRDLICSSYKRLDNACTLTHHRSCYVMCNVQTLPVQEKKTKRSLILAIVP